MDREKISLFMLNNGMFVIGLYNFVASKLEKVLQIGMDEKNSKNFPMCIPLGFPINQGLVTLDIDKLDYLYSSKEINETILKVYEDSVIRVEFPNIVKPKKSTIIH